jgi:hypothetical protein
MDQAGHNDTDLGMRMSALVGRRGRQKELKPFTQDMKAIA